MSYIIYDKTGRILRVVDCSKTLKHLQAKEGEFIIEGFANDLTQKIVDGKVVDKTPEEIEIDDPPPLPPLETPILITKKQWQGVLKRLEVLEKG